MTDPRDTLKLAAEAMHKAALFFAGFLTRPDISNANRSEWEALRASLKDGCAELDRMAAQEPVAVRKWHDEFKCWNYDDIEDVRRAHTGERLYAAPVAPADKQQAALQAISDMAQEECRENDARDAARYRWLRRKFCLTGNGDGTCSMHAINLPGAAKGWPEPDQIMPFCDAAIDAAMEADHE